LNLKRWLIASYLLVLIVFTFLSLMPTAKFRGPTTSDAGMFFGLTDEVTKNDGMIDKYMLGSPPDGEPVGIIDQGQPVIAAMLYKGLHSIFPSITTEDVSRYLPPVFFVLMLIPVFLIGKELAGDLGGCAAAFFLAVMFPPGGTTGPLYWSKVGAFDRDVLEVLLSAWTLFLTIRLFKAPRESTLEFGVIAGLVYGVFALIWTGYLYLLPIIVLALIAVVLNECLTKYRPPGFGLGAVWRSIRGNVPLIQGVGVMFGTAGFIVWALAGDPLGLVLALAAGVVMAFTVLGHAYGVKGLLGVAAVAAVGFIVLGQPLVSFARWGLEFVGLKTPAVVYPRYASEMQPTESWRAAMDGFYGPGVLTSIIILLLTVAVIKIFWTRKRGELLLLPWFLVLLLLGGTQSRFLRMWWPFLAALAGLGIAALVLGLRRLLAEPAVSTSFGWLDVSKKPIAVALCAAMLATPFILNASANVERTGPPMAGELHDGIFDASEWLRENTPENSIVAIEWSFGHLLATVAKRPSMVDGTELGGMEGEWENVAIIRPPDTIWRLRDIEDARRRWGDDAIRRYYVIDPDMKGIKLAEGAGGRRDDMQALTTTVGENEFARIVRTYRDNYNCKIDYVVFLITQIFPATRDMGSNFKNHLSISRVDQTLVFEFDGDNITFDWANAYIQQDGTSLYLAGVVHAYVGKGTKEWLDKNLQRVNPEHIRYLAERLGRQLRANLDVKKLLWLYWEEGALIHAQLSEFGDFPMVLRVYDDFQIPAFMKVVYTSPNGWAKVCEVMHKPVLTSPPNGLTTSDNTPTLRWAEAVGAERYELWVDNNPDFLSPEIVENVSSPAYTPTTALADGTYSWLVRAFRADNTELGWSSTWTFVIDTTPPGAPTLHAPANGVTISDNTPTFEWTVGADATRHRLLIDNNIDFSSPIVDVTLDAPENTYTPPELAVDNYWWKIIAFDQAGNENESQVWTFNLE